MGQKVLEERSGVEIGAKRDQSHRRQWSIEQKRQIVDEALSPGASVSAVSRRYDLNANMIFRWMREMGRKDSFVSPVSDTRQRMVPVGIVPSFPEPVAPYTPLAPALSKEASPDNVCGTIIEIVAGNGARLRFDGRFNGGADGDVVRNIIALVRGLS